MDQVGRFKIRKRDAKPAQGVVVDFKAADTNKDGKLTQTEFIAACDKGLVTASAASGSGSRGMTGGAPTSPKK